MGRYVWNQLGCCCNVVGNADVFFYMVHILVQNQLLLLHIFPEFYAATRRNLRLITCEFCLELQWIMLNVMLILVWAVSLAKVALRHGPWYRLDRLLERLLFRLVWCP